MIDNITDANDKSIFNYTNKTIGFILSIASEICKKIFFLILKLFNGLVT